MYENWLKKLVDQAPYGTKGRLAKAMGIDNNKLYRILVGDRKLQIEELEKAARFFAVPIPTSTPTPNALLGDRVREAIGYVPLYGSAVGGIDGDFVMNGIELDRIACPPGLSSTAGAYAVMVTGDSMAPRFFPGETLFIDPTKVVKAGDFVVAQISSKENRSEPPQAFVKQFVRRNSKHLVLKQFNPPEGESEIMVFDGSLVVSVHFIAWAGYGGF